jgi:hypothetical protein
MDTHGSMVCFRGRVALIIEDHRNDPVTLYRQRPNQSTKPMTPFGDKFSVIATATLPWLISFSLDTRNAKTCQWLLARHPPTVDSCEPKWPASRHASRSATATHVNLEPAVRSAFRPGFRKEPCTSRVEGRSLFRSKGSVYVLPNLRIDSVLHR